MEDTENDLEYQRNCCSKNVRQISSSVFFSFQGKFMLVVLEAGGYQLARINVPDLTHIPEIWKSPGCSFIYHILFVQVTLTVSQGVTNRCPISLLTNSAPRIRVQMRRGELLGLSQ
jgi:hypothetical protein